MFFSFLFIVLQFEMPYWVGRMPSNIGYPAGGSLSADEYKTLALVYLPVIVRSLLL